MGLPMLKVLLAGLSAAALVLVASVTILAQPVIKPAGAISVGSHAPVLNAPYSAKRHFTSVKKLADGTVGRDESGGSEARDSQGRTYSAGERQWKYKGVIKSETLYRIDDPVANTET